MTTRGSASHHSNDPSSRGPRGASSSPKISSTGHLFQDDSEWIRDVSGDADNTNGARDRFNHFLEAGRAMVGKREQGSLLFQGTGVEVDEWAREYENPYVEADLLSQSYAALRESPLIGEDPSKEREVFAQRIEQQQRTLADKEEFLKRVQASSGKARQAVLDAEKSASEAFAMFETLRKQGPFMGFEARARARRKYVAEKAHADALQQEAKKAKIESVNLKQYILTHGLDPSSYENVTKESRQGGAATEEESGASEDDDNSDQTHEEKRLETWEQAYMDGVKLAHMQTVDRRERRLALEKQQQLRRHTAVLEQQKSMRKELREHLSDSDGETSLVETNEALRHTSDEDTAKLKPDEVAHAKVSFQQMDVGRIKNSHIARGLTKDTAPPLCKAWAHAECAKTNAEGCRGRHFFVSDSERLAASSEREKQNARVEMEALLAINTREALLIQIKKEMVECENRQLSSLSTTLGVSDVGLLLQYFNQFRVATVDVIEAVERWQIHMVKHLLPRVKLNGTSKPTDAGWIVKVASRGEKLYDATTAYKSRLKRLSRDARPAKHATDFEVVGIFPTKLEALRAFEQLRAVEAAAKMTTAENLPPYKVVTRSCGVHMCIESDVGLEETRCEVCYAAALGVGCQAPAQGADIGLTGAAPKFLWHGSDYLRKVSQDTHFLEDSSILKRFFANTDFSFRSNPLLLAKDLSVVPLEPAPFQNMEDSVDENQYNSHYTEYVAASFGVPSTKVLIYDNGCSEWFGHVAKSYTVKIGRDLGFVSQLVTSRAAVEAFVKRHRGHSVKILDTARVLHCLEYLRGGPRAVRDLGLVADETTPAPTGSMHIPNIREEDIVEHGEDFAWIFELALGSRRKATMGLSKLERLRLNRVHTAYYWDSGEYIAIRQRRHEDSGLEAGVFCSAARGKPWENDRVRGSHKKRFVFEQKLKQQGEELRMRRNIVQIYLKREMESCYGFRPFVLDYLIFVANQLGGSTLMLDVQQAETFLQSMIRRTTSAITIQRIRRGSCGRQRFQDLRLSLQQRVREACSLDRVGAAQSKKIVALVLQRAVRRAGRRIKPPQLQTSLRLGKRRMVMTICSQGPYERKNMKLIAEPCLACLKAVSRRRPRRDLTSMQLRGVDSVGDTGSVDLGNLHLQRVTERTDCGPCYCVRRQSSSEDQVTLNLFDSTDCRTYRVVLTEAALGRSVQVFQLVRRLQLKAAFLGRVIAKLANATVEKEGEVADAEAEARWRKEARESCAALLEDDRLMAVAADIHLTTMSQVADSAVAFSNDQLALYEDLEASNQQNAWDPLEEANNAIYLQRKRQAEKLLTMTISMLDASRRKNFTQQMNLAAFQNYVGKLKASFKSLEHRAKLRNAELASVEKELEQAKREQDTVVRVILDRIHIRHIASPSKVVLRVGLKKKEHPEGLLFCSVISVKSASIPREPVSKLRVRVSIAASPRRFKSNPVKSVFTWAEAKTSVANPHDPTWQLRAHRADYDGGPGAPFLGCVDVICQLEGTEEETKWFLSEPDLLYLLCDSHRGLPGEPVPELTMSRRVATQRRKGGTPAATFQDRRNEMEDFRAKALKRVVELLHVDTFTGKLKLGKLALLRRREHLLACLNGTQWWKDLHKRRTSKKGVHVLSSTYIIHGKTYTVSVFENHGNLIVDYVAAPLTVNLNGGATGESKNVKTFLLRECDIRAALQDRTEVLAWWSQSVRCCRYSPKLIRAVLDRVYVDANGSFAVTPCHSEVLPAYSRLPSAKGKYHFFIVCRTVMAISDFDTILTVRGNSKGDMQFIVERRPLSSGPALRLALSRVELREFHAVLDLPEDDVSLRDLRKVSNIMIPLLAIRRRVEELPPIRDHPLMKKYCKMLRLGVPPLAVRQKICLDLAGSSAPLAEICRSVLSANPLDIVSPELRIESTLREELVLSNRQQDEHWRLFSKGQFQPEASNSSFCKYQVLHRFSNLWIKLEHEPSPQISSRTSSDTESDASEFDVDLRASQTSGASTTRENALKEALSKSLGVTGTGMLSLSGDVICLQKLMLTKTDQGMLHTTGEFTHRVNQSATAKLEWVSPHCGPEHRVRIYDPVFCNAQFYRVWLKSEDDLITEIDKGVRMLSRWLKSFSLCYCRRGGKLQGYTTWRRHGKKWKGELCLIRVLVHDVRKDIRVIVLPMLGELTLSTILCSTDCIECTSQIQNPKQPVAMELVGQHLEESSAQSETSCSSQDSAKRDEQTIVEKFRERIKLSHWREARMRWMRQNREFKNSVPNPFAFEEIQVGTGFVGNGPERGGCTDNVLGASQPLSILVSSFQSRLLLEEHCLTSTMALEEFLRQRCFYSHGSSGEDVAGFNFVLSRSFSIVRPEIHQRSYVPAKAIAQEHGVQVLVNEPGCKCSLAVPADTLRTYFRPDDSVWMNPWLLALEKFLEEMAVFPNGTGFQIVKLDATWKAELARRESYAVARERRSETDGNVAREKAVKLSHARLVNRLLDHSQKMKSAREGFARKMIQTAHAEWSEMLQADAESTRTRAYLVATPASLDRVKDAFDLFDTDQSGTVSASEFQQLCYEIGEVYSEKQVSAIIAQMDSDKNGEIDLEEFTVWWFTSTHDTTSTGVQLASLKAKLTVYRQMRKMKENAKAMRTTIVSKPLRAAL